MSPGLGHRRLGVLLAAALVLAACGVGPEADPQPLPPAAPSGSPASLPGPGGGPGRS